MRVGVIGASGFIGKAMVKRLAKKGYEIVPFSRSVRERASSYGWRVWDE